MYHSTTMTQKEVCKLLAISLSSLKRWLQRERDGDSLEPLTQNNCGRPSKIETTGLETLKSLVASNPSITLTELSEQYFKKHKVVVGSSILSRALQSLNLRYKKMSLRAVEKESEEVKKKEKTIYQQ